MKFLTFCHDKKELVGVYLEDKNKIYSLKSLGFEFEDMNDFIGKSNDDIAEKIRSKVLEKNENGYSIGDIRILSPILHPVRDVICLGRNYLDHSSELETALAEAKSKTEYAIYFGKAVDRARGDGEAIPSHKTFISTLDYECELAVIIKKDARNVPKEKVEEYIFVYTILNDLTARELSRHKQNYFQKSLDGTCSMGPWIVTSDEIPFPPSLRIRLEVNGETRQDSYTDKMIFGIDHIISELSAGITLPAGTIIATGTPAGVAFGMNPPVFLKDGDCVRCEIEKIGVLNNYIADSI